MDNITIDIQKLKKHTPDVLSPIGVLDTVVTCKYVCSEEYQQDMREKHPDWFKDREL